MPVRLTPDKSLLISYDAVSDKWVTIEGVSLFLLSHYVDVEPNVTVKNIFDLIERNAELKRFLSEYCSCDIDAVRNSKPGANTPLEVPIDVEIHEDGRATAKGVAYVDTIAVTPFFYVFTDENTSQRRLAGRFVLNGRSSKHERCSTNFGAGSEVTYADVKDFTVKLETNMWVEECDEDKIAEGDHDPIAFHANVRYTLLDVLSTIVCHFGTQDFDRRYQQEVDEDIEMLRRFHERSEFQDPDDDDGSAT